jgi:hypothetical protein
MRTQRQNAPPAVDSSLEVDGWMTIQLDDDLLAHVALVVFAKLRRNEPLLVSWTDPAGSPTQAWLHPNSTVVARHTAGADTTIDRRRAERMMIAANSTHGLRLSPEALEPAAEPPAVRPVAAAS